MLKELVQNPNTVSQRHYIHYLKVLNELCDYEKLLESTEEMQKLYPNDLSPFEWICKVYVKLYLDNHDMEHLFAERAKTASTKLLEENTESVMGLLTKAVLLYKNSNMIDAKELLVKGRH